VIFGILLWKSDDLNSENGDEIFYLVWGLVFVNLFWIYTYRKYKRISITLLFAALLLGYFVYNAVFLSELTDNNETRYLNLLSVYIIWIGLMITILIESPDYNLSVST
jgi:peptidoglycan/LPS O-acetylase OafA/YrhL